MVEALEEYRTSDEIKKEMTALNLELVFQKRFDEELDKLVKECENSDPYMEDMVRDADARILRRIYSKNRKGQMRDLVFCVLPRAGKIVAGLALTFFIGLSTAVATVRSVRINVLNFITEIEDRYTALYLQESGATIDIPESWNGLYYMTYIPEGFVPVEWGENEVIYADEIGNVLGFCEYEHGATCNLDTENAEITYESIRGKSALVVEKDGWIAITWSEGSRFIVLDLMGEKEDALRIAENVVTIR